MMQDTIQRVALGKSMGLGFLYNAYNEKSCNVSILKENPPPSDSTIAREIPNTQSDYVHVKSTSDKFSSLNVEPALKTSILFGLASFSGSGKYLHEEKTSARVATVSLVHKITTKQENLSILDSKLRGSINLDALKHRGATHVVTGITWGANLIITAEYKNDEKKDVKEVAGELEAEIKFWRNFTFAASAKRPKMENDYQASSNFQLKINGDILIPDQLPQTIEEAVKLVGKLSHLVNQYNNGKGVPVHYELTSLGSIESYFGFNVKINRILYNLEEETCLRLVDLFDQINIAKQTLNDFCDDVDKFQNNLPAERRAKIRELRQGALVAESKIRSEMQTALVQVRSGLAEASDLEEKREEYEAGPFGPVSIHHKIGVDFRDLRGKIEYLERLCADGVHVVSNKVHTLTNKLLEFKAKQVYVLFGESEGTKGEFWRDHYTAFRSLHNDPDEAKISDFLYVDVDSAPHLKPEGEQFDRQKVLLQRFNKIGHCVDEDVLATFLKERAVNLAKSDQLAPVDNVNIHHNKALLELPCPKFFVDHYGKRCGQKLHNWKCLNCEDEIQYGFDDFFYCSCGRAPAESYKFKCLNVEHGDQEYVYFPKDRLKSYLDKIRKMKALNILIMGETGVGKSTWINGILNYFMYSSLEKAADDDNEILCAIPMSFNIGDDKGKMVQVQVGKDKNEEVEQGQSATQSPCAYTFHYENMLVRLIDTPGMCDTRGIEQDKKNVDGILGFLQMYEEIHGICILLPPNNARLTASFTFCIKQILAHLHRDASNNIVFCFTNSRAIMYCPAETSASLGKILKDINKNIVLSEHTQYFMENEAIRFLAAYKNYNVKFPTSSIKVFSASWKQSTDETKRLFKHLMKLAPHSTEDTLSLNKARRMITDLGLPLQQTAQLIDRNLALAEQHRETIKSIDDKTAELDKALRIPVTRLNKVDLGYPRTVCAATKCCKFVQGDHGQSHKVYSQVCHDNCKVKGVSTGMTNESLLRGCSAIDSSGNCHRCGCPWSFHMHQTYDVELTDGFQEVESVKEALNREKDSKEKSIEASRQIADRIKQLQEEKQIIAEVTARFALFLKHFAVCYFNDATSAYLDWLIANEKDNVKINPEQVLSNVKHYESQKRAHEEQKKILEERLKTGESLEQEELSVKKIREAIQTLFNLPINGSVIKEMMSAADRAVQNMTYNSEKQLDGIGKKPKKTSKTWGQAIKSWIPFGRSDAEIYDLQLSTMSEKTSSVSINKSKAARRK